MELAFPASLFLRLLHVGKVKSSSISLKWEPFNLRSPADHKNVAVLSGFPF